MNSLANEIAELRPSADAALLPRAWGEPLARADLRSSPEDFAVSETTGLQLSGQGEHVYIRLRKIGQNTRWVARQLAEFAHLPYRSVSYAGLKDRHAVTDQWFSLHMPGAATPDWSELDLPDVTILEVNRHDRKLRQGQLSYNRFQVTLRNCSEFDAQSLAVRLEHVRSSGVPNYFGPQRFGIGGGNLELVLRQPNLRRLDREARSFALSALRAALYNGYLAARVADGSWLTRLEGDALLSDRPRGAAESDESMFSPERIPAAPLWGKGAGGSGQVALARETEYFGRYPAVTAALERAGARFSRRVLRARVAQLECRHAQGALSLGFALGPGVFATTVLREILDATDRALPVAA